MRVSRRDRTLLVDILAGITGRDVPGGMIAAGAEHPKTTIARCLTGNLIHEVGDYLYLTDAGFDIAWEETQT